jgi:hypothetical protein
MASIVAERLIVRLERDGVVIMRRPPAAGARASDDQLESWGFRLG